MNRPFSLLSGRETERIGLRRRASLGGAGKSGQSAL